MPDLHRTIYVSRARGAAAESLQALAEIIGVSQRNNQRDGLTGLLLAHDGWFLQVVEGAKADLDRLMRRLTGDPRHGEIRLLESVETSGRRFADWSMAQARITPQAVTHLRDIRLDTLEASQALRLLEAARPA